MLKDAIDLVRGHYIASVSRSMTTKTKEDGLEALAVSNPIVNQLSVFAYLVHLSIFFHSSIHDPRYICQLKLDLYYGVHEVESVNFGNPMPQVLVIINNLLMYVTV